VGDKLENWNFFYYAAGAYSVTFLKPGWSLAAAYSLTKMTVGENALVSPSLTASMARQCWQKKGRIAASYSGVIGLPQWQKSVAGRVTNLKCALGYTYHKKHVFSINYMQMFRKDAAVASGASLYTGPYTAGLMEWTLLAGWNVCGELFRLKHAHGVK
jgi:hypothetical protein